jgi:hypothetical protein
MTRLRFAMVCASNMNRSMEAHAALAAEGLQVRARPPLSHCCQQYGAPPPHHFPTHTRRPGLAELSQDAGRRRRSHPSQQVESYGIGKTVKLPGPSADAPNMYPFGTLYADIEVRWRGAGKGPVVGLRCPQQH